jgi:uncharacterized protein with FMN-binding domain
VRRITLWALATVCGVVLLFSYRTSLGGSNSQSGSSGQQGDPGAAVTGAGSGGTASNSATSGTTSGSGGGKDGTFTGKAISTRHGIVQVKAVISGGKLTDVVVLQKPNNNHEDQQINNYALPILRQSALKSQSANVDMISGATVTSQGYKQSLQSALDQANFK